MLDKAGAVKMNVNVDRARCGDQSLAIANRRSARHDQVRIDTIHDRGVARLADTDDAPMANAEIAFDDSDHRVDHEDVAKQKIKGAFGARDARHPDAIAKRLAAAMQAFIAVNSMVHLDHSCQRGVAKADRVASRRTVKGCIVTPVDPCHFIKLL